VEQATVRPETLVALRWLAIGGQAAAIGFTQFVLGLPLPLLPALACVILAAVFNLAVATRSGRPLPRLAPGRAMLHLGFDILQLATLLGLTGGLGNPFALLLLVPVTVSATILGPRETVALGLLGAGLASVLAVVRLPLAWPPPGFALPPLYIFGVWLALLLGMGFLALYAWRVAHESRLLAAALAETQLALARETELGRLGGLAAAAAHELGTPLGTIALAAGEIAHGVGADHALAPDVQRLLAASKQARGILARLAAGDAARAGTAEVEGATPFARLPMSALVEAAAEPAERAGVVLSLDANGPGAQPLVRRQPEVVHGLRNLIGNAVDFARAEVAARVQWSAEEIAVEVSDDGPGFALHVLDVVGEPFVTTRRRAGGHGLGVFIAKALLERSGAHLRFSNRPGGGAVVRVTWPRLALEAGGRP
jgi:two-component system sensor histidine kinase RegB